MKQHHAIRKNDHTYTGVNPLVTAQAMEFFQRNDSFVSVRDVPLIKVDAAVGVLSFVDQDLINMDEVRERTSEAEAGKSVLGFKTVNYATDARSLEFDINALMEKRIMRENGGNLSLTVPRALGMKGNIHTEVRFGTSCFVGGSWFRVVTGAAADGADNGNSSAQNRKYWSDPTADITSAVRDEIDTFLIRTGLLPTNFRMGRKLFTTVAKHPIIRAQVATMIAGSNLTMAMTNLATEAQLSQLWGIKVSVSSAIKNTAKQGEAAANQFILTDSSALMTFDTPGDFTATAGEGDSPPLVDLGAPTGFARVAYTAVAPNGFAVRSFPRPEIGPGGSMAHVLDIYNGYVIVDNRFGTFFSVLKQ